MAQDRRSRTNRYFEDGYRSYRSGRDEPSSISEQMQNTHISRNEQPHSRYRDAHSNRSAIHGVEKRLPNGVVIRLGSVIHMRMSELFGSNGRRLGVASSQNSGSRIPIPNSDEEVFTGYRRYVVVDINFLHCIGVPITSYSGRGVAKPGINVFDHAIIADERNDAVLLQGEPEMSKDPIFVRWLSKRRHTLTPDSRVNFGAPYSIQYNNTSIELVGQVRHADIYKLIQYSPRLPKPFAQDQFESQGHASHSFGNPVTSALSYSNRGEYSLTQAEFESEPQSGRMNTPRNLGTGVAPTPQSYVYGAEGYSAPNEDSQTYPPQPHQSYANYSQEQYYQAPWDG
ncbi:hypothetical protein MAP00_006042 [Monascus purpureus]|nr:hypothetical protein MAP00_006042 [Monascus purpureus]